MSTMRGWLFSALAALVLHIVFTWPLALHWTTGIPSSAQNIEQPPWRYSIPGDHLQLLYHFDLVHDMFTGRIPWFHNVYEFNTGDDAGRYRPGAYFFPMSGVYALLRELIGQAAAWNTTLWLSVWISIIFLWKWLRRFTADRMALTLGVLVIVMIPFRWISLLGGSPAGIALMWLSILVWSLDVAIRAPTWRAGFGLGLVLLMCFWADLQVFYLTVVFLPVFALISMTAATYEVTARWRQWFRIVPGVLFFTAVIALFYLWRKENLAGSTMGEGRSWHELAVYSPRKSSLVILGKGINDTVFMGGGVMIAILLGLLNRAWTNRRSPVMPGHQLWLLVGVAIAAGLAIALSLGVHGPFRGELIKIAREVLPHYNMIRQPSKIFAVIPLLLGWLLAVGWSGGVGEAVRSKYMRQTLLVALAVWIAVELKGTVSASICLLETEQRAYAEVAREAQMQGDEPGRIMVIPLWPGDAADTSLPMHFAQKYNLRMINGYSPVVSRDYQENVFRRLESMNQGWVDHNQIDFLLERGIRYLIVHEDMFPEKVSPFPITETLDRLTAHPRIQPMIQAEAVHAFRLLEQPAMTPPDPPPPSHLFSVAFPARRWDLENMPQKGGESRSADLADRGLYWHASEDLVDGAWVETRPARVAPAEDLFWWLRIRGEGRFHAQTFWNDTLFYTQDISIDTSEWSWVSFPLRHSGRHEQVRLRLEHDDGDIDIDLLLLVAGHWPIDWPAEGVDIPAAAFFHAGFMDADRTSVVFRASHDAARTLLYGPKLPFPVGRYRIDVRFSSPAPDGTRLGEFNVRVRERDEIEWTPVIAGEPASTTWWSYTNLPMHVNFVYNRAADMRVHSIQITPDPEVDRVMP